MSHIKVGVLRGGEGDGYDISMSMGARVIDMLKREPYCREYQPVDIIIDKAGVWHIGGFPVLAEKAMRHIDVVFNAMHGTYGGDGRVQHILETFHMPFTGSTAAGTMMAKDKKLTRDTLKRAGIKTPYARDLHMDIADEVEPIAHDLFKTFPMPVVVKPRHANDSTGVSVARNFDELVKAIDHARVFSPDIVVEEYITGKEIISGFIEGFRDQDHYPLIPVEVKPLSKLDRHTRIFNYSDKISGNYDHTVPADLSHDEKMQIADIVKTAKEAFAMRHMGTVDFIVSPRRGVYVLEVNTHPHLHDHAPFLKSLHAVGSGEEELVAHLIRLALGR
jgi:D-alanine-D-alanine ligase